MTNKVLLVPAIGLLATTTAIAQESAADAAEEAAEAAAETAPVQTQPTIPPPAPPALIIPPPAPTGYRPPAPPPRDASQPAMPQNYFAITPKQADYPTALWAAGEEGTVEYLIRVSPEGSPIDCTIITSSGFAALDAKTCEVAMERSEFDPARNAKGEAIAGEFQEQFTWRKREPEFPGTARIQVRFTLNEKGETVDCEVIEKSGALSESMRRSFEREPCPTSRSNRTPYRDENGVPISKQVTVSFDIMVEDAAE
ncbi:MAG: TonB family protein [Pseudomonadota bacterium]